MQRLPQNPVVSPRTGVLVGMIVFAVAVRLLIYFVPGVLPYNFTPVEAIALFGGAYFADKRLAVVAPLAVMLLADMVIATTLPTNWLRDWLGTLPAVYACIALTTCGGFALRNRVSTFRVGIGAFASAVLFFVVTNFATWLTAHAGGGEACTQGLADCYIAGIPFFRGTLVGTLFWSAALFGGFELLRRRWTALQTTTV
jgi:hypothetical protein